MSAPPGNPFKPRTGVELLRLTVRLCDNGNESFNMRFSADELIRLASAWESCEFDIPPHRWEARQVAEALRGTVPKFNDDETPKYEDG